jgi:NitT/TauT family transport system permease protein
VTRIAIVELWAGRITMGILVFGLWELSSGRFFNDFWISRPSAIATRILDMAGNGDLWYHLQATLAETLMGLAIGMIVGTLMGVALAFSGQFAGWTFPYVMAVYSLPKVALAPLFVVWFGYGIFPRVLITVSIAFFPVLVSTVTGLKSVDPEILRLARSMRAQNRQVFLRVRLPNALPSAFAGLKVATSLAVIGAIIGEFVASDRGWGYMLVQASGSLDTSLMFAVVICLAVVASLLFYAVDVAERTVISWHASHRQ